jgi:hypothetical protein
MSVREWKIGDRVVHATKPEWGIGEVRSAESTVHEGVKCQRLTLRFERAGVKTLSTAFAELRSPDEMGHTPATMAAEGPTNDPLMGDESPEERIVRLPDPAIDPFTTPRNRLKATLALYRFSRDGGSLLDWAASQTGMRDPLTRFSRHDLERLFERFRVGLDSHLRRVVGEVRKADPRALTELLSSAPEAGQQALRRLDGPR